MYGSAGAPWRCLCLSSREMDVLQLVAEGLTNGAIAERPVLAPRTVETHVANLVAKGKSPDAAA
jgi:DNA-binding NarL/FixJ family response regulator